ncbi:MAG: hypothetical protein HW404_1511, partial [Anaerolineales bacterium]|nr:hypothetical protein [Anaerolineales bacterium]
KSWILAAAAMAASLLGCWPTTDVQGGPTAAAPFGAEPTAPTTPPELAPTPAPAASGDDVSSYIACEIVTAQDVADLVGGPIYRELEQEPSPACIYEIVAGPDGYAQFIVYIEPTDMVEPLIENIPDQLGDPLPGIGDAAYLKYDEAAENYRLIVLVRGRFGLEVSGEGEEWVLGIGELFLSRLVGP